mmetsp:Transcript_6030/g.17248  ORF Transcript_6030/g.17248 Transcript_6030/m.17248 type:complete len:95 (+) Transcript_6030:124-408(+)
MGQQLAGVATLSACPSPRRRACRSPSGAGRSPGRLGARSPGAAAGLGPDPFQLAAAPSNASEAAADPKSKPKNPKMPKKQGSKELDAWRQLGVF